MSQRHRYVTWFTSTVACFNRGFSNICVVQLFSFVLCTLFMHSWFIRNFQPGLKEYTRPFFSITHYMNWLSTARHYQLYIMPLKNIICIPWLRENILLFLILIGVLLGVLGGVMLNRKVQTSTSPPPRELIMYIAFAGEIFLRMLQLLVLPLVVSSVIVSLASLDKSSAAKLGKRAIGCILFTTLIAVVLGIILALLLKPGVTKAVEKRSEVGSKNVKVIHTILDLIR